jgi:RNA polymerase sigma factor (sigma-70 family)
MADDEFARFTGLYDRYYQNVLRYVLQHVQRDIAEDVTSEAFLIAWRRLPDVPEPSLPWLLGVARNLLRKQASAGYAQRQLADRVAAMTSPDDLVSWDAGEWAVERGAALSALACLAPGDVEALTLTAWHGLGPAEAAEVVGCSRQAFAVRLHRARQRLADALVIAQSEAEPAVPVPSGPPGSALSRNSQAWR